MVSGWPSFVGFVDEQYKFSAQDIDQKIFQNVQARGGLRGRGVMRGGRGAPVIRGAINIRGAPVVARGMPARGGRVMRAQARPMAPGRGAPIRVGNVRGGVTVRGGPTILRGGATINRGGAQRMPVNVRPGNPNMRPTVRPGNVRPMLRPGARPMMRPMMRPGMTMRPVRPMNGARPMMRPAGAPGNQPKINIVFEPQHRSSVSP